MEDEDELGADNTTTTTTGEAKGGDDSVVSREEIDFEVCSPKIARKPMLPTKAEVDAHYPSHLNYRSWCKHCVAGKARSSPHIRKDKEDEEKFGVAWNVDYAFMGGEYNEAEESMQTSLVMYDDDKDSFWAIGTDEKGANEAMVKYGMGTIENLVTPARR